MSERPIASLVPYVIEDTGRGERAMDIFSRLLKDRIVLIGQEITDQLANVVIAQLLFLMTDDPKKDIQIYINSPGGYITAGLAIYDTIRFLGCDVNTYCIGQAASMGALLLAAGSKGKRRSLPHGRVMIHQPSGGIMGTSADIKLQAEEILRLKQYLAEILADCSGQSVEKILADSDRDYFMNPQEAIEYGLIDEIITTKV
ncbi:MAG: ATP-dependent Clp protease proteolytic subunit [Chlamydiales bacterium]|nr:ATP-dependent Clp protease proteolytic subunit [Chlamydiales bacterium]MCH9619475.1 ATP-dependent Clp protease proteolytic subunit [Chlamydiales bacterium]MCH9622279.1 ATP-dependent Clp protease proteolytic subunit [Chlamydiales bacterium]